MPCEHSPSADPRHTRADGHWSCVKCGKLQPPAPKRDPQREGEFYAVVADMVRQQFKVDPEALYAMTRERIRWGAELYGDMDWLTKDNAYNGQEEQADSVAYALFESLTVDAHEADGMDADSANEARMHMRAAAMFSVMADWHFRAGRAVHHRSWIPRQAE